MFRHVLLNWVSCAHSLLPQVPSQLSFYFSFVLFMRTMSVLLPLLWKCVVIFISVFFKFTIPTWSNSRLRRPCPPRKRKIVWQWCALPYFLVCLCCRRHWHHPSWLGGSLFSLPQCTAAWILGRIVRVSVHARAFFHWLAKFMGGCKNTPAKDIYCENETPSLLTGEV